MGRGVDVAAEALSITVPAGKPILLGGSSSALALTVTGESSSSRPSASASKTR